MDLEEKPLPIAKYYTCRDIATALFGPLIGERGEQRRKAFLDKYKEWIDSKKKQVSKLMPYAGDELSKFEALTKFWDSIKISGNPSEEKLAQYLIHMNNYRLYKEKPDQKVPIVVQQTMELLKHKQTKYLLKELKKRRVNLNIGALLGAYELGLDLNTEPLARSMSNFFCKFAEYRGKNPYHKASIIKHLRTTIDMLTTDQHIEYTPRDKGRSFKEFWMGENIDGLENIVNERVEMLKHSSIYIKPMAGACAEGVLRVQYDTANHTLTIKTSDFKIPQELFDPAIYAYFFEDKKDVLKTRVENEETILTLTNGKEFVIESGFDFPNLSHYTEIQPGIKFPDYDIDLWPMKYLHKFDFKKQDDNTYIIKVKPKELSQLLKGLEGIFYNLDSATYAEAEIQTPKIGGKTWEIRVINIHSGFHNAKPEASYVKMGSNDVVANISQGGAGNDVSKTVQDAYRQLRPDLTEKQIEDLVAEYIIHVNTSAIKTVKEISHYLTAERNKYASDFPLARVPADSCSTDFMAEIYYDKDNKPLLKPRLVDVNFNFGMEGLKDVDLKAYERIKKIQQAKINAIDEFITYAVGRNI